MSVFIGSGATLAQLSLTRVKDIDFETVTTASVGEPSGAVIARARAVGSNWVVVVDDAGAPLAWPSLAEIAATSEVAGFADPRLPVVAPSSTLNDALDQMLAASQGGALVAAPGGRLLGWLRIGTIMEVIRGQLDAANPDEPGYVEYAEAEADSGGTP